MVTNNVRYFEEQQCSTQWRVFLESFATEFSTKADVRELRQFMYQLGRNMGARLEVRDASSVSALQTCMNRIWYDMNFGYVQLIEESDALVVAHRASPLKVAFGVASLAWTPALLEGIYAQWFDGLGMDKSLKLSQKGEPLEDGQLFVFELKKQVEESGFFGRR